VTGVVYFDKQKRSQRQKAKSVILSANGAETPKLLLMSKSTRFPDGLANSNGAVGKYLMFDTGAMAGGVFEHPLNEYKGAVVSRIVHDFYEIDPKHGFLGGRDSTRALIYILQVSHRAASHPTCHSGAASSKKICGTFPA
jgi:choline dehydrogenase-like flavoprotein